MDSQSINPVWEASASYSQFVFESYQFLLNNVDKTRNNYTFPADFTKDLSRVADNLTVNDLLIGIALSFAWSLVRHLCTVHLFKPLAAHRRLPVTVASKVPESLWKLSFYLCSWTFSAYMVLFQYGYLHRPSTIWQDYSPNMAVPTNIYIIYMAQISFYINSLYTAVLVDQWRRDSPVLIVHHVITVILLVFTLSLRCHRSGLMALFLHDVCDILLEATKTLLYFKTQAGQPVKVCQTMADIGFALFSVTWFVNRLYLFPLRNIYISWSYPSDNHLDIPFLFALTCLLYLLLAMNVYWFSFILNLLYKVVTGQVLEDSREYEEPEAEMDLKKSDIQVEISQNGGPGNSIDEEISSESVLRRRRDILAPESDSKGRSN